MAWDDEAGQLTLEVVSRLGVAALDGVYAQAIDDVQRSGLEVLVVEPESCREWCSHPARVCLPATTCWGHTRPACGRSSPSRVSGWCRPNRTSKAGRDGCERDSDTSGGIRGRRNGNPGIDAVGTGDQQAVRADP